MYVHSYRFIESERDLSESKHEEKKASPAVRPKLPETSAGPCPVIPDHIKRIMDTVDAVDAGKIDEFEAVSGISGILAERKRARVEALKKVASKESEESNEENTATE
jgi:hypothetical protein